MGWGTPCQPCPQPDSEEFEQLCPFGSGKTHSGDGKIRLFKFSNGITVNSNFADQTSTNVLRIPIFAQTEPARTYWAPTDVFAILATKWTVLAKHARTSMNAQSTISFVTEGSVVTLPAASK